MSGRRSHRGPPRASTYLDNNATTDVDPEVTRFMQHSMHQFCGNPSSGHTEGTSSRHILEGCRLICSQFFGCEPTEMFFTSGATESNNIVLQGFIRKTLREGRKPRILCTPIEHVSVLNVLRYYKDVIDLYEVPVRNQATDHKNGQVDLDDFERAIVEHKIELATVIFVNHEIGTVQHIQRLGEIAHRHGAFLHSDCTQAIGKVPIDLSTLQTHVDAVSCSAHKFYGPKGVGCLVVRKKLRDHIQQITYGGDQEMTLRPGTENVTGVIGMTKALELCKKHFTRDKKHLEELAHLLGQLLFYKYGVKYVLNSTSNFAINMTFEHIPMTSDQLLAHLSKLDICVSKGAACKTRTKAESYILHAVYGDYGPHGPTIRVGIGRFNTREDIEKLAKALADVEVKPKPKPYTAKQKKEILDQVQSFGKLGI